MNPTMLATIGGFHLGSLVDKFTKTRRAFASPPKSPNGGYKHTPSRKRKKEAFAAVKSKAWVVNMKCLIIKQPWIELILSGKKTWEMRSRPTNIRGRIGLIEQGTGLIVGEAELTDCMESITNFDIGYCQHLHKIEDIELLEKWHIPWVLENAKRYEKPIPYKHPQGAVVWVNVEKWYG